MHVTEAHNVTTWDTARSKVSSHTHIYIDISYILVCARVCILLDADMNAMMIIDKSVSCKVIQSSIKTKKYD